MPGYTRHPRHRELFKYPNSEVWWMFIPNPKGGRALRESTKQRDDVAAHRVFLNRIRRGDLDGAEDASNERTLRDALKTRLDWLRTNRKNDDPTRKKLSQDTIDFYKKKSGVLTRVLGPDSLLSEITTPNRIREYIATRTDEGTKGTTIGKELTALSMAVKLAHKDGVNCRLIRDVKPEDFVTTYVPRERWLTRDEYERFISWWYAHRQAGKGAVLDFIVATGATCPSEVVRQLRSGVNTKTFEVHIRGTKRKSRDRIFSVPSDRREFFVRAVENADGKGSSLFGPWGNINRDLHVACAYLSMCKRCETAHNLWWHDPVTGDWAQGTHQSLGTPSRDPNCTACKRVKVFEPFCPTDLRRTFAQWLMQAGVPYELAYPLMGHTDDRMLKQVYGKRSATDVGHLIEAVLQKPRRHLRAV